MTRRKIKKIIIAIMLFANIISSVFASTLDPSFGAYNIYYHDDPISYVTYGTVSQKNYEYYYLDEYGNEQTVYCLNLGAPGAEDYNGYEVSANQTVQDALNDSVVSSIIANSYPYKSLEELRLSTVSEARFASQFAIWTYTSGLNLSLLYANLPEYQRVVDAINTIYSNGTSNSYNPTTPVELYEERIGMDLDKINSNFYSKKYIISKNANVESIKLKSSTQDVIITDEENHKIEELAGYDSFKVLIPVSSIKEDSNIKLEFETKLKENISLMGMSTIPAMQNVALTFEPVRIKDISINMDVKKLNSVLKITKVDKDNPSIKIPNVKFKITNARTGKEYGIFTTDSNGEITLDLISDLKIDEECKVRVEEVEVPKEYYIDYDNNVKEIYLKFGTINNITFENKKAMGKIKILKTSVNGNELSNISADTPLEGAKFAIYDLEGNLLEELKTNKEGIAISKDLPVGKYILKEIEAPKYYKLDKKEIEFEITKNGVELLITVKNDNIDIPKRLPNTGC